MMYYEIDEKAVQVCQHCKYTEYEFITGWHKIDRTLAIDEYLNNNVLQLYAVVRRGNCV